MKTIEVVAAIIRRGDSIFATQRGYGEFKDWWEFPGGKIEPGNSHQSLNSPYPRWVAKIESPRRMMAATTSMVFIGICFGYFLNRTFQ